MSMKELAERCEAYAEARKDPLLGEAFHKLGRAACALADAVLAREADGREPITAEWLRGLEGWKNDEREHWINLQGGTTVFVRLLLGGEIWTMIQHRRAEVRIPTVTTRRQLLDLLSGLRGGE